jgi:hypothetical protein
LSGRRAAGIRSFVSRRQALAPYLLLAALVVVFMGDLLLTGRSFALRDTFANFLPWRAYVRDSLAAGEVPWWNPYGAYGKPFVADTETGFFYPPNLLLAVLPVVMAMKVSWMLHLWIAGAGLFTLARELGLRVASALLAAVAFMFGTFPVALLESQHGLATIVWAPLVLFCLRRLVGAWADASDAEPEAVRILRAARPTALLALVAAVQFMAGHAEFYVFSMAFSAVVFGTWCARELRGARLAGALLCALAAALIASALVLPQLVPTLEVLPRSDRTIMQDPQMGVASVSPRHLLALLFPFLYGSLGYNGRYWADSVQEFTVGTCHVGMLPLLLAPCSLLYARRGGERRALVVLLWALAAAGLVIAMGKYTPVARVLYGLPLFTHFRWPAKFHFWVWLALPLLAGLGYEALEERVGSRGWRRLLLGLAVLLLAASILGRDRLVAISESASRLSGNGALPPQRLAALTAHLGEQVLFLAAAVAALAALVSGRLSAGARATLAIGCTFAALARVGRQIHPILPDSIYTESPGAGVVGTLRSENWRIHTFVNGLNVAQLLYGEDRPQVYRWAKAAGAEDCWLPYGINSTYSGGFKLARNEYIPLGLDTLPDDLKVTLSRLANVRWWIVDRPGPGRRSFSLDRIETDCLSSTLPRAYLVSRWTPASGQDGSDVLLLVRSGLFEHGALVDSNPDGTALPDPPRTDPLLPEGRPVAVSGFVPARNSVRIDADAPGASLLVLVDTWYPGWRAYVDGRPQPIYRVNIWFRGVFLDVGRHRVDFVYRPTGMDLAVAGAAAGALATALLWVCGGRSKRLFSAA